MSRVKDELHGLSFGVKRSKRYHHRREKFYDQFSKVIKLGTLVSGSGTIIALLGKLHTGIPLVLSSIATILSFLEFVIDPTAKLYLHKNLYGKFCELEEDLERSQNEIYAERLSKLREKRIDIEKSEPPKLRVLDTLCHNELIRAEGYGKEHLVEIKWHQKCLAQFCDVGADGMRQKRELE
jgi:hypothetical protein